VEVNFHLRGEEIQVVFKIKYLGYIYQCNGRWNSHIKGIKKISFLKRVILSRIIPILHYSVEIWGHEKVAQLQNIQ